jgi:hypothetical protein
MDVLLRLSAVLGVYAASRIPFAEESETVAWLRSSRSDPLYGGRAPLDLLLGTVDDALAVRADLEAWCQGTCRPPITGVDDGLPYTDDEIMFS